MHPSPSLLEPLVADGPLSHWSKERLRDRLTKLLYLHAVIMRNQGVGPWSDVHRHITISIADVVTELETRHSE